MNSPSRSEKRDMSYDPMQLRRALGCFATGVTVVTTTGPGGDVVGLTVNSFSSVSLDPPLILWSLKRTSRNLEAFRQAGRFAVNVLRSDQHSLAERFCLIGPERFEGVDYHWGELDLPILCDALAWFECRTDSEFDGGDHVIVLGQVMSFRYTDHAPLLFHGGDFYHLGQPVYGLPETSLLSKNNRV